MTGDVVYEALRAEILNGELSPGEQLGEEGLAARLGASRTAVRSAIARLDHDGLVVRERNRSARVRRISLSEAVEILEARAALEPVAAGYAALRRSDDDVAQLRELDERMRRDVEAERLFSMSEENASWHLKILDISGHDAVRVLCARLYSQIVRFQFHTAFPAARPATSVLEHTAIVDAIEARNRAAAEQAMRAHLEGVADVLVRDSADEQLAS
jgi:DNA-binding GntR family transcriptional regulator